MRPHMALDGKTPAELCGIEDGRRSLKMLLINLTKEFNMMYVKEVIWAN
jgi:hypothetical protein